MSTGEGHGGVKTTVQQIGPNFQGGGSDSNYSFSVVRCRWMWALKRNRLIPYCLGRGSGKRFRGRENRGPAHNIMGQNFFLPHV
eukprot:scaffold11051_cov16-Tisochrysis_lutea.AAC.1